MRHQREQVGRQQTGAGAKSGWGRSGLYGVRAWRQQDQEPVAGHVCGEEGREIPFGNLPACQKHIELCEIIETIRKKHMRLMSVGSITLDCCAGQSNLSELARVCELSRTTGYKYINLLEG